MVPSINSANASGDVFIPMSPLDAVMNTYRVVVLYIFPPQVDQYDLQQLHHSFITLINEDYPVLIGELLVDRDSGSVSVKQTASARQTGAASIRFEKDPTNPQTTAEALVSLSWEFVPKARADGEIIAVKCSILADGGLAVSVDCSHILFDGEAMITFMKLWGQHFSGVAKEKRLVINHHRHLLTGTGDVCRLPHDEFQTNPTKPLVRQPDGSLAPKAAAKPPQTSQHIFHLTPSNMAKLKKVVNEEIQGLPSYVSTLDAVTALFTILITKARGHGQDIRVSTAVNGRQRLDPPLPENYAGNAVMHAVSSHKSDVLQIDGKVSPAQLCSVALGVRASILERDNLFMRDTIAFLAQQRNPTTINDNVDFFFGPDVAFTSWAGMGLYDAEFGGLRPSYASIPRVPCMDGFVLITEAANSKAGWDVLVCLEASTMDRVKTLSAAVSYLHDQN